MLKLSRGPFWLDLLPGVRVQFAPVSVAAYLAAREAARKAYAEGGEEQQIRDRTSVAFTVAMAQRGILAWEGVGDEEGNPIEPTPDKVTYGSDGEVVGFEPGTISAFLDYFPAYEAVDRLYVGPVVLAEAEKNGSSPSPNGASAGATPTAPPAELSAQPAPTGSTSPEPTTAS